MQATVFGDGSSAEVAWELGVPWQERGITPKAAMVVEWLSGAHAGLEPTTDPVDGDVVLAAAA